MATLEDAIEQIEKFGEMFEVAEVKTYRGFRKKDQAEVTITVYDHGEEAGSNRYFVMAHKEGDDPEKFAKGNGGDTFENALGILHWSDLDT